MLKKLALLLCLLAGLAAAQTTPYVGFAKPPRGSANWDKPLNLNFDLLDQLLSGHRTLPASFWTLNPQVTAWANITGKPATFPSDWSILASKPTLFPTALPTTSAPGGVFMPASCSVGSHVWGINTSNGQLICTPDLNPLLNISVNGVQVATGVSTLDFVASAGITISSNYNSGTGHVTFIITGSTATQAQAPTFNPLPGAYSAGQNVTLACASPSPTIYYTTNGTTPTHGSSVYSSPVAVTNTTLEAICASSGLSDSNVITGIYSLQAPTVSLTPSSFTWTTPVAVNYSSLYQVATLANTGNGALTITSIAMSGDYSGQWDCPMSPSTLAAGSQCLIQIRLIPTATGTRTGTLTVTDNASGSPHTASLTGTGAQPAASPSPTALNFGSQTVGTTSAAQAITVTNGNTVDLYVSSVTFSGANAADFSQTANCSTVAANGGTCTINVAFTPAASGARSATLSITDNAANSPQLVTLSGSGSIPAAPIATLTPSSLTFTGQKVGTTSAAQTLTLSNSGNASLVVSSVSIAGSNPGDFAQTNNCTTVSAGSSCTINVSFSPAVAASRSASVSVQDNAAGSPQGSTLSGTGLLPTVTVAPGGVTFGTYKVGTSSGLQGVTLTNTSSVTLNLSSITASGDFAQTNNCGSTLAASGQCTINISFTPTGAGTRSGSVSISDDAASSPQTVSLSGTGAVATMSLAPASLTFGAQLTGTTSAAQGITLTNTSAVVLNISSITTSGDFAATNNCGSTVAASGTCTINVTFSPTGGGARNGTLTVLDDATGSPHSAALSGTGTVQTPAVNLNPGVLSFGAVCLDNVKTLSTTLTNTGNGTLSISSIGVSSASGAYSEGDTCGTSLGAGSSCSISVSFNPTGSTGSKPGTLTVNDNASGSPHTVTLSGSGTTTGCV